MKVIAKWFWFFPELFFSFLMSSSLLKTQKGYFVMRIFLKMCLDIWIWCSHPFICKYKACPAERALAKISAIGLEDFAKRQGKPTSSNIRDPWNCNYLEIKWKKKDVLLKLNSKQHIISLDYVHKYKIIFCQ